jgi:hypothetical protein
MLESFPLLSEHTGKILVQEQSKILKSVQMQGGGMHELMHDFMCKFYKKIPKNWDVTGAY